MNDHLDLETCTILDLIKYVKFNLTWALSEGFRLAPLSSSKIARDY